MSLAMNDYSRTAKLLSVIGFEAVPIARGTKRPVMDKWTTADLTGIADRWPFGCGIGIRTGMVTAIDVDVYVPHLANQVLCKLKELAKEKERLVRRIGLPPKFLVPVYCNGLERKMQSPAIIDAHGVVNRIEALSYGQQFVAYGVHPDTGKEYEWIDGDMIVNTLPVFSMDDIETLFRFFKEIASKFCLENPTFKLLAEPQAREIKSSPAKRSVDYSRNGNETPIAYYNRTVDISTVLNHYGWRPFRDNYWTRPGKKSGISGAVADGKVYVFTSSTCLQQERSHDAFEVAALYSFNGDKTAMARAVKAKMNENNNLE